MDNSTEAIEANVSANSPKQTNNSTESATVLLKTKKKKPGVVYLNYIPRHMNVKKVREHFSEFGEVRRLFLKPEQSKKVGKPAKFFKEGWVEFANRKIAKRVAECLNGAQVGGRRHSPYYEALWSIRYLPRFQWSQLNEAKVYDKARKEQRMRAEIAKVKREVNFYTENVAKMRLVKKYGNTSFKLDDEQEKQRTDDLQASQIVENVTENSTSTKDRQSLLLRRVFGAAVK